jgi:hypothetical protein
VIAEIRGAGAASLRAIADALNRRRIAAPRGGTWAAPQVRDLVRRIELVKSYPKAMAL